MNKKLIVRMLFVAVLSIFHSLQIAGCSDPPDRAAPLNELPKASTAKDSQAQQTPITYSRSNSNTLPVTSADNRAPSLEGYGIIRGTVLDTLQHPVANVSIHARLADWNWEDGPSRDMVSLHTMSDSGGSFEFRNLPEGDWALVAMTADAAAADSRRIARSLAVRDDLTLTLRPGLPISARVLDEDGNAVSDAMVYPLAYQTLSTVLGSDGVAARVYTDENGRFRFPVLWIGTWYLAIHADGWAPKVVEARAGDDDVVFELNRGLTVNGRLTHRDTNEPVGLAWLYLRPEEHAISTKRIQLDSNGKFTLNGVNPGKYRVDLIESDWVLLNDVVEIPPSENGSTITLDLPVAPGGIIAGVIIDENDNAITGKRVIAMGRHISGSATSGDDGSFVIRGLREGAYRLTTEDSPPQNDADSVIEITEGERIDGITYTPKRTPKLVVRVVDQAGNPVKSAMVYYGSQSLFGRGFAVNPDGTAVIQRPREEAYLLATGNGTMSELLGPLVADQTEVELRLDITANSTMEGVVTDAAGRPYSANQMYISVRNAEIGGPLLPFKSVDSAGRFRFEPLAPGNYDVLLSEYDMPSNLEPVATVSVAPGQKLKDVMIAAGGGLSITGRVVSGGEGIFEAEVLLNGPQPRVMMTRPDGSFSFVGLEDREYEIRAMSGGGSTEFLPVSPGVPITLQLVPRPTLSGSVRSARTGAPVPEFSVYSFDAGENANEYFGRNHSAHKDSEGKFTHTTLDIKVNTLRITAKGFAPTEISLPALHPGQELEGLDIALPDGGIIQGLLTDMQGRPVPDQSVIIGEGFENARSDKDGVFVIDSLPESDVHLRTIANEFLPGEVDVHVSPGKTVPVTIQLSRGATIDVSIVAENVLDRIEIRIVSEQNETVYQNARLGKHYSANKLYPGRYRVTIWDSQNPARTQSIDVDVTEGTTSVEMTL